MSLVHNMLVAIQVSLITHSIKLLIVSALHVNTVVPVHKLPVMSFGLDISVTYA